MYTVLVLLLVFFCFFFLTFFVIRVLPSFSSVIVTLL